MLFIKIKFIFIFLKKSKYEYNDSKYMALFAILVYFYYNEIFINILRAYKYSIYFAQSWFWFTVHINKTFWKLKFLINLIKPIKNKYKIFSKLMTN